MTMMTMTNRVLLHSHYCQHRQFELWLWLRRPHDGSYYEHDEDGHSHPEMVK
jgi:hypothetical protein